MLSLEALWGQAFAAARLSQAYLLIGEEAAAVAGEFLLRVYCERRCRECAVCSKILHRTHPDVQWLQKEGKRIGIDQIRQLQRDARYRPLESHRKVYILEGAEDLSPEAANSLLKILEAPPEYVIFLLLARNLKILPTILSRCQIVRLKPLSPAQIQETLQAQGLDEQEAEYALALTQGFPQRLSRLLDAKPNGEATRLLKRKKELLNELQKLQGPELIDFLAEAEGLHEEREVSLEILLRLRSQKPYELLEMAQALSRLSPEKLEFFFQEALRWYRDLALDDAELLFNRDRLEDLKANRVHLDMNKIAQALAALEGSRGMLQGNANALLFLESLLFRLTGLG